MPTYQQKSYREGTEEALSQRMVNEMIDNARKRPATLQRSRGEAALTVVAGLAAIFLLWVIFS